MLENPRALNLFILEILLEREIGEGSEAENFTGGREICVVHCVKVSTSDSLNIRRYGSSKSGFQPPPKYSHKHVT